MAEEKKMLDRRQFIGTAATVGAIGVVGMSSLLAACGEKKSVKWHLPPLLAQAPDGILLKAGLVGCGGRGTGAALNFLKAGANLQISALADVLPDRLDECRKKLKEEKLVEIADENCFLGFDAYQKLIDSGVDIVLLATPPHFRPEHFAACVNARKHVFMEKPVAVDPVGARSIMASAKKAEAIGLCVVTGTQRRHQHDYIATFKHIVDGAIGEIVGANCYWNQSQLWYKLRGKSWSDMEYQIRDWVNWCWLSGDHIVEQHVHNIDVINWFTGSHPVKAVSFGSRLRRVTGDQYDFFSVDFVYENDMHLHSMCRQIDGCTDNVSEFIMGTKGWSNCQNKIVNHKGKVIWEYPYPKKEEGKENEIKQISPYDQEHTDLVTAIRTNQPMNEAEDTAISTMTGIMGRLSAYTGKEVNWDEVMNSSLRLGPTEYKLGPADMRVVIPVAGANQAEEEKA